MTLHGAGDDVPSISFSHVIKRYGTVAALTDFSAEALPGRITAFLGPNGSGKTTSMRVLLGLADPTAGTAMIHGRRYTDLAHPLRTVGAVLDQGFHPNRSARSHLRIAAAQAGVPAARADDLLDLVGLNGAARRRVGGYSLGMRQRLALASALIGDPSVLVLDEPYNGLDPAGIQTMRAFLREFADNGGTVLLSSHLLAEITHTADDAIIINNGRLVTAGPIATLVPASAATVVTTPDARQLETALIATTASAHVARTGPDQLTVTGVSTEVIGRTAISAGAIILGMHAEGDDLEVIFQNLIHPKEPVS